MNSTTPSAVEADGAGAKAPAPEPAELKAGTYVGKDGHRYRIFSDGKTYREEYLEVRRRDKAGEIHVTRKGPSLRYVGNSRVKA